MKYAMMADHAAQFGVQMMCRVMMVSASGYYDWCRRGPSTQAQARALLDGEVKLAFEAQKARAGAPRLTLALKAQGCSAGHNQVAASLRRQGLRARAARKFKATTNSNHSLPVVANLLNQDFTAERADEKWVSDITYGTPRRCRSPPRGGNNA